MTKLNIIVRLKKEVHVTWIWNSKDKRYHKTNQPNYMDAEI